MVRLNASMLFRGWYRPGVGAKTGFSTWWLLPILVWNTIREKEINFNELIKHFIFYREIVHFCFTSRSPVTCCDVFLR